MSAPAEQVFGWRVWRLRERSLHSLVLDYRWVPGKNLAACLAPGREPCGQPPGPHCNCGFWAASSPKHALARTCATIEPPWQVLGLVAMSGAVVDHGAEGLRAHRAEVRCLCMDRPWSWRHPRAAGVDWDVLKSVAEDYAVPLLSLSNAVNLGITARSDDPNLLSTLAGRPPPGDRGRTAR